MRPAFSVILLTTLIGTGQGLFLALVTLQLYALLGLVPALPADAAAGFGSGGAALALALLAAGLAASFFHLGRPERAWRSAAMWRTSWLAREVIVLPAFMGTVALYALLLGAGWSPVLATLPSGVAVDLALLVGLVGTVLAFALYVCTGMIYASLRFLAEWHTPLVPINYTLIGGASGFTLAAALAALAAPAWAPFLSGWAAVLTLLAAIGRGAAWWRMARLKPRSTLQTAIGIKHPVVVQRSKGFMGGSFNTREFFHGRSDAFVRRARVVAVLLGFALPLLALAGGGARLGGAALVAVFLLQWLGLVAERWCFFAEARHPQNLYYAAAT